MSPEQFFDIGLKACGFLLVAISPLAVGYGLAALIERIGNPELKVKHAKHFLIIDPQTPDYLGEPNDSVIDHLCDHRWWSRLQHGTSKFHTIPFHDHVYEWNKTHLKKKVILSFHRNLWGYHYRVTCGNADDIVMFKLKWMSK
jgi:hypothetical protein